MRELVQARLNPLDSGPVLDDNDANWRLRSSPVSGIGPLAGVGQQEAEMRIRLLKSIGASTVAVSVFVFLNPTEMTAQNQAPTASVKTPVAAPVLKTPWGEPDLQDPLQ